MQIKNFQKNQLEILANSVILRPSTYMEKWCYEFGLILKGIEAIWMETGNEKYFNFIKDNIDRFIDPGGNISGYDPSELNLDQINPGKALLLLYKETSENKYLIAAKTLRDQLVRQPRNSQGGFWHKRIYPHQMWLDGVYMSSPFYCQYALMFNESEAFDDIANQVFLLNTHARDPITGLLYHAWDESKGMKWSDDLTGCSPHFWGRAIGWYAMALVDILDNYPIENDKRNKILEIFISLMNAVLAVQDEATGVWYQIVDMSGRTGNYLEASASCMFSYVLAKGINKGYLDNAFKPAVTKAFNGIIKQFLETDENGLINLSNICSVAGLGGNPYRNGSFSYYISEPVAVNDYKGYGPLLLACVEMINLGE
jgi:unsaturated rhamnogalacturonyl hydrolase